MKASVATTRTLVLPRMSSYSELVKSFEKIRAYMREFYVYGFKSREEYSAKSA